MATVISITNKLKNEPKFVEFEGKNYKVDDSKNTVLEAQAILASATNGNDLQALSEAMAKLLGEGPAKDFDHLAIEDYQSAFFAVMACVNGKSYEETEAMFRGTSEG